MAGAHSQISAKLHFSTGFAVVLLAAALSYFLHETAFDRHLEMANLDAWFGLGGAAQDAHIAVVGITGDDYAGPVFRRSCPLRTDAVAKLIHAVALSGPSAIVIDLDTSEWKPAQRIAVQSDVEHLPQRPGRAKPPQLAWAIGGSEDTHGKVTLETLDDPGGCFGVPASIPDDYGVVRGYLPYVPFGGAQVPSLAEVAAHLGAGKSCDARVPAAAAQALPPVDLIEYSGGPGRFVHLAAGLLFGAAETDAWQNSNPLQGRIVVVGGQFLEARDRYVTPAGYLDGVDILAHAIASVEKGGIPEPNERTLLVTDLVLGCLLVTLSFFVHGVRMLAISFLAIPFFALATSFALFHYTGYFMSFMPILAAVFLHHLMEHGVEDWRLKAEHGRLKKEVAELRGRLGGQTHPAQPAPPPIDPAGT